MLSVLTPQTEQQNNKETLDMLDRDVCSLDCWDDIMCAYISYVQLYQLHAVSILRF